jgi:hypothetical protein
MVSRQLLAAFLTVLEHAMMLFGRVARSLVLALMALLFLPGCSPQTAPDTVFVNGKIWRDKDGKLTGKFTGPEFPEEALSYVQQHLRKSPALSQATLTSNTVP